jgi:glutathione S-transferase
MNTEHKIGLPPVTGDTATGAAKETSEITLYSAWYCPFAQRTWATLEYLGIPYEYRETDPYHKSLEWLDVSRGTGQVPVLEIPVQKGAPFRVPGSIRSLEYLDDAQDDGINLFTSGASNRADVRYWLDIQGTAIIPYFYRFLKADQDSLQADQARDQMLTGLQLFVEAMASEGPYFTGNTPSAVDFAFAPFALRIELLLAHYKDFVLPTTGEPWARYATWWACIKVHPAFQNTMPEHETYDARLIEFYLPYSKGCGQEDVTKLA